MSSGKTIFQLIVNTLMGNVTVICSLQVNFSRSLYTYMYIKILLINLTSLLFFQETFENVVPLSCWNIFLRKAAVCYAGTMGWWWTQEGMFTGTASYITHKDAEMQYAKNSKHGASAGPSSLGFLLHQYKNIREVFHLVAICCYYMGKAECSVHTPSDLTNF